MFFFLYGSDTDAVQRLPGNRFEEEPLRSEELHAVLRVPATLNDRHFLPLYFTSQRVLKQNMFYSENRSL